jgi:hypothetical protein
MNLIATFYLMGIAATALDLTTRSARPSIKAIARRSTLWILYAFGQAGWFLWTFRIRPWIHSLASTDNTPTTDD